MIDRSRDRRCNNIRNSVKLRDCPRENRIRAPEILHQLGGIPATMHPLACEEPKDNDRP